MALEYNINISTLNSRELQEFIRNTLLVLKRNGYCPHSAVFRLVGAELLNDLPIDWIEAEIICFIQIKKHILNGDYYYDA